MTTHTRVFRVELRAQSLAIAKRAASRILTELEVEAKINAAGGKYSKGTLSRSVYKSGPMAEGSVIRGSVGSRSPHARVVEFGARVHNIFPKGAPHIYRFGPKRRPMLKFIWHGHMVYMNQIPGGRGTVGRSHPGMRGKHWLGKALVSVALRNRLRVIVYDI